MTTERRQVTSYVEPALYAALEAAAKVDRRSVSAYVERLLSAALALPVPQSAVPNGTNKASAITQALKLDAAARREAAGVPQSAVPKRTAKPAASSPEEERRGRVAYVLALERIHHMRREHGRRLPAEMFKISPDGTLADVLAQLKAIRAAVKAASSVPPKDKR